MHIHQNMFGESVIRIFRFDYKDLHGNIYDEVKHGYNDDIILYGMTWH